MKKFAVSYLACLMFFSISINILAYQKPNYAETWGPIWVSIIMYVILGSIPVFIGCLLGEFFYRKIKKSYKLQFGIPLFVLLGFFYGYLVRIIIFGEHITSLAFSIPDFVECSPIMLASLLFYFIRRF
ncbi:hypothetical protein [Bacillus cereus group sp. BfR-BA-01310]|uniref:hypothetical protein n=1 Tax=Bacillus cereus group sp. BfR-BA-01310 TaxID=2920287 RepID=UPI001F5A1317|nr:hypothetical protein [Bacillus cereus group sp. BfR-BA-01310]